MPGVCEDSRAVTLCDFPAAKIIEEFHTGKIIRGLDKKNEYNLSHRVLAFFPFGVSVSFWGYQD